MEQPAGQDGPGHGGQAHQRADRHQGPAQVLGREHDLHQGQALRDHDRPEQALQQAGDDQEDDIGGETAGQRGQGEAGHAEQEQPTAAEQVPEPARGDQAEREGRGVGAQHPLHGHLAAAEVRADGRAGQVGHAGVDQVHDVGDNHDDQDEPCAAQRQRAGDKRFGWALVNGHEHCSTSEQCSGQYEHCSSRYRTPFAHRLICWHAIYHSAATAR